MDWYWVLAGVLVVVGYIGLILPVLPGIVFIFSGLLLAAWIDGFSKVSEITMIVVGVLSLLVWAVDFVASYFTAKKARASKLALVGTIIGALLGILGGIVGLIVGPIIGAVIGEFISRRNSTDAARVGLAAGLGFVAGAIVKMMMSAIIIAIFFIAYFN